MNRPTFEKTVDILVKAYLNDTLEHRKCEACAVGNLIRANGYPIYRDPINDSETYWLRYLDSEIRNRGTVDCDYNRRIAIEQINATGYCAKEVSKIEQAFESAWGYHLSIEDAMFNGLMAVVDVLAEIHGVDLEVKESAKLLFVKP